MDFQESRGAEITITAYPAAPPRSTPLSRPNTAPTLRNQFLLALHKARSYLQTRTQSKPTQSLAAQEPGACFPRPTVSWVKPAHKFVRFCEKRRSRPQWNAWKLRPSFQVNALPLMSSIVANKATEHVISPVLPTNLEAKVSQSVELECTEEKSEAVAKAVGKAALDTGKS